MHYSWASGHLRSCLRRPGIAARTQGLWLRTRSPAVAHAVRLLPAFIAPFLSCFQGNSGQSLRGFCRHHRSALHYITAHGEDAILHRIGDRAFSFHVKESWRPRISRGERQSCPDFCQRSSDRLKARGELTAE
ncbi:hypothetical protein SKAU_G00226420 [Synaphobranchus kaupii]|uniref:Uncharacterized protein n=1 Tax=Synaphobranchus kaupii TaxID=118154 RepID=A0A9Q1F4Q9_SYNKA|nr:hypothetical protein SKAU_G00226420 [Synaphobranchus kaupii]